jgi:hypothetical protein
MLLQRLSTEYLRKRRSVATKHPSEDILRNRSLRACVTISQSPSLQGRTPSFTLCTTEYRLPQRPRSHAPQTKSNDRRSQPGSIVDWQTRFQDWSHRRFNSRNRSRTRRIVRSSKNSRVRALNLSSAVPNALLVNLGCQLLDEPRQHLVRPLLIPAELRGA